MKYSFLIQLDLFMGKFIFSCISEIYLFMGDGIRIISRILVTLSKADVEKISALPFVKEPLKGGVTVLLKFYSV